MTTISEFFHGSRNWRPYYHKFSELEQTYCGWDKVPIGAVGWWGYHNAYLKLSNQYVFVIDKDDNRQFIDVNDVPDKLGDTVKTTTGYTDWFPFT